jgi:hypothetical protein
MKKYALLVLLAGYSGLICSQENWDYEFVRDQSGATSLALIPTPMSAYSGFSSAFVAVHLGEDWFFRTFDGWTKWKENPSEISPVFFFYDRSILIASGFDPSKLPPFEIYASWGGDDLTQIIANGWYQRVLHSEDLPPPPKECTPKAAFCHTFRSIVRVVKRRATNEYTPPETLALTATFDGVKFFGSDTGGCLYSGTLQPVVGPLGDTFTYTVAEPGMQVTECQDPERNGWYETFFISYEQAMPSLFFAHANNNPRRPFLLIGSSLSLYPIY